MNIMELSKVEFSKEEYQISETFSISHWYKVLKAPGVDFRNKFLLFKHIEIFNTTIPLKRGISCDAGCGRQNTFNPSKDSFVLISEKNYEDYLGATFLCNLCTKKWLGKEKVGEIETSFKISSL